MALSSIFNLGNDDDDDDDRTSSKTAKNGPSKDSRTKSSNDDNNAFGSNEIKESNSNSTSNSNSNEATDRAAKRRNKWGPPPTVDPMAMALGRLTIPLTMHVTMPNSFIP